MDVGAVAKYDETLKMQYNYKDFQCFNDLDKKRTHIPGAILFSGLPSAPKFFACVVGMPDLFLFCQFQFQSSCGTSTSGWQHGACHCKKGEDAGGQGEKHLRAPGVGTQNQRLRFHLDHSQVSVPFLIRDSHKQTGSASFIHILYTHMAEVDEQGEDTGKGNVGPHRQVDV